MKYPGNKTPSVYECQNRAQSKAAVSYGPSGTGNRPDCVFHLRPAALIFSLAILMVAPCVFRTAASQQSAQSDGTIATVPSLPSFTFTRERSATRSDVDLPSRRYRIDSNSLARPYRLDPFDASILTSRAENQVGIDRPVDEDIDSLAETVRNSDGTRIRLFAIKSPGAAALRVHFQDVDLAEGDQLFVYGSDSVSHVSGPCIGRGPFGDGDFWSDAVEGDTVIVEHFVKSRRSTSQIRVSEVGHMFIGLDQSPILPQLLSCEVDANCGSFAEKDAVGRILFNSGTGQFVCSGTLLNNRKLDGTPFFLTAAHCVSTESAARTVQTFWFYQTSTCNVTTPLRASATSGTGTNLLVTDTSSDQTLLRVLGTLPGGVLFAGWNPNVRSVGTQAYGLHHPGGGIPPSTTSFLRSANGTINGSANCPATGLFGGYLVNWTAGSTEPGSSGSGLFLADGSGLIGALSCGPSNVSCDPGLNLGLYGKLSDFYRVAAPFLENGADALGCISSLVPSSSDFNATGGSGSFNVNAPAACNWTATSNASWVTITGAASGSGNGSVTYTVAPNSAATPRTTSISLQGQSHVITQAAFTCDYGVSPALRSFDAPGGTASVSVSASPGCAWTAVATVQWIRITSATQGIANGSINYSVAANPGPDQRSGQITVEGKVHFVTQNAPSCSFGVSPASASIPVSGGQGTIAVTAGAGCRWSATSNASWLTILGAGSGTGNGTVNYSASLNIGGAARAGRIIIADKFCDVTQATGPLISDALIDGKKLIVIGVNFGLGAELLMDGVKQKKTSNDGSNPSTMLIARKSGKKKIAPGQTVRLQVRNPDGTLSSEFAFTRSSNLSIPAPPDTRIQTNRPPVRRSKRRSG